MMNIWWHFNNRDLLRLSSKRKLNNTIVIDTERENILKTVPDIK
jgi:hypothetical protein